MIPWTTHFCFAGFKFETCEYGGWCFSFSCGQFHAGLGVNPSDAAIDASQKEKS
jgi:hypothetical protein